MTPARAFAIALALGATGLVAGDGSATRTTGAGAAMFIEAKWPFGLDQWGRGRAFACDTTRCGVDAKLYIRAKVGFCDCFNHVDEDDVDRLTDFDLIGKAVPRGPDRALRLGEDPARLRTFRLEGPKEFGQAVSVVAARDCQALVALLVTDREPLPALESAVLSLMRTSSPSDTALAWNN